MGGRLADEILLVAAMSGECSFKERRRRKGIGRSEADHQKTRMLRCSTLARRSVIDVKPDSSVNMASRASVFAMLRLGEPCMREQADLHSRIIVMHIQRIRL